MTTISNNDIAEAIYASTKGKTGKELDECVIRSVKLLREHKLLSQSDIILSKIQKLIDDNEGITRVKVISHQALKPSTRKDLSKALKEKYQTKEVVLEEIISSEILGGLRIEVGDEVIDISLKNKIQKLHDYLIKN
ncbi:MAG: F0F1 ATP synthase subunit delta [Candidatus Pacebacteria bacterium]|nr:F0F1 ATP synthase subunit delta [Candidatus Paceibacterota bacterium]